MWLFKKKEDNIENLMKDCNKLYVDFKYSFTLAHSQSYYDFKKIMNFHFNEMKDYIGKETNETNLKSLLLHFKEQLIFFQKHPFSCTPEEFKKFAEKHLPYVEKIQSIIRENNSINCKVKL